MENKMKKESKIAVIDAKTGMDMVLSVILEQKPDGQEIYTMAGHNFGFVVERSVINTVIFTLKHRMLKEEREETADATRQHRTTDP